jgi:hypothetical protein
MRFEQAQKERIALKNPQEVARIHKLALDGIQKLVPRKPQRLNEISDMFHKRIKASESNIEEA